MITKPKIEIDLAKVTQLASEGMTMLIVTHEMRFARDVSTRIFFMNEGIIYEDGSAEQIFEHPVRSATKAFVNRIQKLVYEIGSDDFDQLDMHSGINAFCIKYNIADKAAQAISIADDMIQNHMASVRPLTFRLTYTELTSETAMDFMVDDMGLYLTTHCDDADAFALYRKQVAGGDAWSDLMNPGYSGVWSGRSLNMFANGVAVYAT